MKLLPALKDAQTVPNVCTQSTVHYDIRHRIFNPLWKFLSTSQAALPDTSCLVNPRCALEAENVPSRLSRWDWWPEIDECSSQDTDLGMKLRSRWYTRHRFRDNLPHSPSPSCTISLTIIPLAPHTGHKLYIGSVVTYIYCIHVCVFWACAWVRVTFGMCMWRLSSKCAILITTGNSDGSKVCNAFQ